MNRTAPLRACLVAVALAVALPAGAQEPPPGSAGAPDGGSAFDRFLDNANRLFDSAGELVDQGMSDTQAAINRTLVLPSSPSFGALASQLIGTPVMDTDGDRVAEVADLVITPDGAVALVVLRRGGTLGFGGELVAADFALLEALPQPDGTMAYRLDGSVYDLPPYRAAGEE